MVASTGEWQYVRGLKSGDTQVVNRESFAWFMVGGEKGRLGQAEEVNGTIISGSRKVMSSDGA